MYIYLYTMDLICVNNKKMKIHTSWGAFIKENYRKTSKSTHQEIMSDLANQWDHLDESTRRVYDQKARQLEIRDNANPRINRQTGWSLFQKTKWPGYKADGLSTQEIRTKISKAWAVADKAHWNQLAKTA